MRAVVLHGPGDLRIVEVPEPTFPPGGLIVRPGAVGICGSDVRTWRHGSPRLSGPQVPGHEFAGTVVASDVTELPVGTRVAVCPGAPCQACRACQAGNGNLCPRRQVLGYDLPGAMAESIAIPADWIRTGGVVALASAAPIERGALVEPLHTVINGQDQVAIRAGEAVLVLGLGPIGVLHVAHARSLGATVLGVDPLAERVERAGRILGDGLIVRMTDGWIDRVRRAVDGAGFDVVITAGGAVDAIATAIELAEPGGRVLAFTGLPPGSPTIDLDMNALHYRQLSIVGAFGGTPDTFRRASAWFDRTPFDVEAFTPQRFSLDQAVDAFEAVAAGHGLKTILQVADGA